MDNAAWSDLWLKRRRRDGVRENWFASCAVEGFGREDRIEKCDKLVISDPGI